MAHLLKTSVLLLLLTSVAALPAAAGPVLWAVDATQRVTPDAEPESSNRIWSGTRGEVRVRAAQGESEGFHLVVTAEGAALNALELTATDLTGDAGTIGRERVHLYREAFFDVTEISDVEGHPRIGSTGTVPDALIPFVDPYGSGQEVGIPFNVPAGTSQPLWVLVEVPRSAGAGSYEATLSLRRRGNGTVLGTVTMVLEVLPFAIPRRPTFKAFFNLDPSLLSALHGNAGGARAATIERNALEELARRRIAPGYQYPRLPSYDNDGFDWSAAEAEWFHWLETRDSSVVNLPPIYDDENEQYRIQKPNGQPYTSADLTPGSHFDAQARLFYSRLWDDLDERGWVERAVIYLEVDDKGQLSDEPYTQDPATYDRIRAWADIFHRPDPDDPAKRFPFLVAGDSVMASAPYADLRGSVDVWDHYIDEIDTNVEAYRERLASFPEEEVWLVPNSYGDFIDYPALHHRSLGFFAWKTGATGLEHWSSIAWFDAAENPVSPWNPANLTPVWGWGAGAELWPGQNVERRGISIDGPLPSLRLELNRQAFEDYEYLTLLADSGYADMASALATAAVPTRLWDGLKTDRDQYERSRSAAIAALTSRAATQTITGTVRDSSGKAVPGALVLDGTYAAATGADGTYSLTRLAGANPLNATADGYLPATVVPKGTGSVELTLSRLARDVETMFGSFETEGDLWEAEGATIELSTEHTTDGSKSLHATFLNAGKEPVIFPQDAAGPSDWSGFDAFEMDVFNDSPWLTELEVDVYDKAGKETISLFYLNPGEPTTVRIPIAGMTSAADDVNWIEIYADSSGKGSRDLYFDHPRLVKVTGTDTSAPGAPKGLTAAAGDDPPRAGLPRPWVDLTWQPPATDSGGGAVTGIRGYEILRGLPGKNPKDLLNPHEVVTDPAYRDLEVGPGETWAYAVRAVDFAGNVGPSSARVEVTTAGEATSGCVEDDQTLCLNQDRFRVEVSWRNFKDETGEGQVAPAHSADSGLFWFFDAANWEMLVKVLDGCSVNGHYWVFAAATTNVEYTLTVTDTETGQVQSYFNKLGVSSPAITDSSAFATCP